jgi:hypothetical protein
MMLRWISLVPPATERPRASITAALARWPCGMHCLCNVADERDALLSS